MPPQPELKPLTVHAASHVLTRPSEMPTLHRCEVLIVGSGAAGLYAALCAAATAEVTLLTKGRLLESNSSLAQGGIAVALSGSDSTDSHLRDTLIAAAGLADEAAVRGLVEDGPALLREIASLGVPFNWHHDDFALGLEGGHSHHRILHVDDRTGAALTETLAHRVNDNPRIHVHEEVHVVELCHQAGECVGLMAADAGDRLHLYRAGAVILATGGAGGLFPLTSNPPFALGEGVAMAYRAGASVADVEFVQFHPTVLRQRNGRGFLISEAVRGEGAHLLSRRGRFMHHYDERAELAPRDIVARSMYREMEQEGADHILFSVTHLPDGFIQQRFPQIYAKCLQEGYDLEREAIPVQPAAHYYMGGVRSGLSGESDLPGLYVAGEVSCTGVHGANRLASNSLLECLVFGRRAGRAASSYARSHSVSVNGDGSALIGQLPEAAPSEDDSDTAHLDTLEQVRQTLGRFAGIVRTGEGLQQAAETLAPLETVPESQKYRVQTANAVLLARLIVQGALAREESRGGHFRADFPESDDAWRVHLIWKRGEPVSAAQELRSMGDAPVRSISH